MQILILASFICWISASSAQELETSLPSKFNLRSESIEILGSYNDLVYAHINDRHDHRIVTYRKDNLGLKWEKDLAYDDNKYSFGDLLFDKGQFTLFITDKKSGSKYLFAKRYNADLVPDTVLHKIDSIGGSFAKAYPEYGFVQSESRDYTLCYYVDQVFNGDDNLKYTLLNRDLKVLTHGELKVPTGSRHNELYAIEVDNMGRIYVVVAEFKDLSQEHARRYWLMSSESGFKEINHIDIQPKDGVYLNNVKFKIDNYNRTLVVAGFYAEDYKKPAYAEGVYFERIRLSDRESIVKQYQKFEPDFIARIQGARAGKAGRLYTFVVDQILLRQDGGAMVVAESFYKTYRRSPEIYDIYGMPMYSETSISYHFDEILAFSVHPDGAFHWKNVLLKHQTSTGDFGRYSSYTLMNSGDLLTFLFNDQISNRTNVITYTVDVQGNMRRNVLLNSRKHDLYLMPQFGKQVSASELIIPSVKRNELKLVKISF